MPSDVVVVTGAAGALGRRVVRRLAADPGVGRVVAIDRVAVDETSPTVRRIQADLRQLDLDDVLADARCLVHLAVGEGTEADPSGTDPVVAIETFSRLLDAAAKHGVAHVVLLSSAAVYGAWPNNPVPLTEDAPLRPNPEFAYAVQFSQVERVLADWLLDHPSVSATVLRPCPALAEGDAGWLARSLAQAAGIRAGDEDPPVQFVHLDDLAAAVDLARATSLDGIVNVAPDGWIAGRTARALRGNPPRVELPPSVASRLASWSWRWRLGPVPPGLVPYTMHPWVVANDRLRAAGWVPRWTNEEAFVAGTSGTWWSTVTPKRRQELAIAVAGLGTAGSLAAVVAAVAAWRRRLRRRARSA